MGAEERGAAARGTRDAAVVGGGLSGLAAALALARCGRSVVLVDREPAEPRGGPARDGRTTAIAAAGRAMLSALGVWDGLAAGASPILDIRVSDGASRRFVHYGRREAGGGPMGHIVENAALRRALRDAVAADPAVEFRAGAALARFEAGPGAVEIGTADGGEVRARLLVGADGRDSAARRLSGIPATRLSYGQTSMVCVVAHGRPHRGVAHERFLPGGPLAFLPMAGDRSSVVWTERRAAAAALMALDDDAFADALAARFDDCLGALRVEGRRSAYPLSLVNVERQTAPRLALVGDAAHGIHPIAGQGFNLGLRDVAWLAEETAEAARLGLDIGDAEVLRRFQTRRRFDAAAIVFATDGLNRLFSNDFAPARAARRAGLGLVNGLPALKRAFTRHAMGLSGELPSLLRGRLP